MKKLKQIWAIVKMIMRFLPRFIKEFNDSKKLVLEVKDEWYKKFPPKLPPAEDISFKELTLKPRSKGYSTILRDGGKTKKRMPPMTSTDRMPKGGEHPQLKDSLRKDFERKVDRDVPDGHSYFKKKPGKAK